MNESPTYSRSQLRITKLQNAKIDHALLCGLIDKFKEARQANANARMPRELAEVFMVLIEKIINSGSWRGYTDDWKEDFRGLALCHICKYSVRFDKTKSSDAVNYFYTMISNAFKQALKKCKTYNEYFGGDYNPELDYGDGEAKALESQVFIPDYL